MNKIQVKMEIDKNNIPQHIAIIMDGNGRWAKKQGAMRIFGHQNAIKSVRDATEGCAELGVKYLTLYAFSTENWQRPKHEVEGLMNLLVDTIKKEIPTLQKNNVSLNSIGDLSRLPEKCQAKLLKAIDDTKNNTGLRLNLALSYSGRQEIIDATKKIITDIQNNTLKIEDITEENFNNYLQTYPAPDPELLIRTSGELRISNFLLWQIAYTEIFVTPTLWPDFRKKDLHEAILNYQTRERRFGGVKV